MTTKRNLKALTAAQIVKLAICPYCGKQVTRKAARGPKARYCSPECNIAQNNRDKPDGAAIIKFAKAWREARGQGPVGKAAFAEMTAAIDLMLDADRESGRPSALYAAAVSLDSGLTYRDRRRT